MLAPRRIAAVSAARWMAQALGEEVGQTIGYAIRFDRKFSKNTRIEIVTEGILTRRILADPGMEGVAMVIFDEFHERSIQTDLALALCLDIRSGLREELKLLVMSATLDIGPIAALLSGAPVIAAEGQAFPVEERYRPDIRNKPFDVRIADAVRVALHETVGDILVFLPGAGEIRRAADTLNSTVIQDKGDVTLHPLYGDLPFAEQERAILPSRNRKVVLATNIAETSLTIEGVRVVIDGGLTRRLQYDPATGMNRLVTVNVSRAAADQRKGRAGRFGRGVCYRLYSHHAYESFMPYALPEMLVSDLATLALELSAWGVKDPLSLSWLDQPPAAAWDAARLLLTDLDALDAKGTLTPVGASMARLPLHPRLSRLLLKAADFGNLSLGADLAALLSERDILRRSLIAAEQPDASDISGRRDILHAWRKDRKAPGGADPSAMRTVADVSKQLLRLLSGKVSPENSPDDDMIARLLLSAYPDRIAKRREDAVDRYLLSSGRGVRLSGSGGPARSSYLVACHVDGGEKAEGTVHIAEPVTEVLIRKEMKEHIETLRRISWDKREGRIISILEERLGAITLSSKPFNATDEEAAALVCEAIRSSAATLRFNAATRQFQGRIALMGRTFPEEDWPDLSEEALVAAPEEWLLPFLGRMRTQQQLDAIDLLPPLAARLSWDQRRLLDERAPKALIVPSGHSVTLDYTAGDIPVLAVKLQEMFGLADTPSIACGRVKVLIHLLSPARRPVQITRDLKGFWNDGYVQVKKELKGRYPKHPWPDDPWNAVPTRRVSPPHRTKRTPSPS